MITKQTVKFALTGLLFATASTTAFGATQGSIALSGTVAKSSSLVVTPVSGGANTSLSIVTTQSNLKVGTAVETSNDLAGYSISISSPTGGFLQNGGNTAIQTPYTVIYNSGSSVTPTVSGVVVKPATALTALTTVSSDVFVNVTGLPTAPSGIYSDTLTITLTAL